MTCLPTCPPRYLMGAHLEDGKLRGTWTCLRCGSEEPLTPESERQRLQAIAAERFHRKRRAEHRAAGIKVERGEGDLPPHLVARLVAMQRAPAERRARSSALS